MAHDELRPFAMAEAETVAGWAASGAERQRLDGESAPLRRADIALWLMECQAAFTLRRDGDLAGYGEIVEDEVAQDVEIQHVLVAPDMRCAGVGRMILQRLCALLEETRPYGEVWLRAERTNDAMIVCAYAADFTDAPDMSGPRYLWLKKPLSPKKIIPL
jgi:GNAT superfamily N-acetyltransferase